MTMGTQGSGRKRLPNRERLTAEDDALNQIAREAEARLAAKRAARAEARDIRMKELERQQKEIYQVQKKYYGLDTKWGDIEQWMEDSERYSRRSRRNTSASDEDERVSVGSRGSLRAQPNLEYGGPYAWTNGYDGELYGSHSLSRRSGNSSYSGEGRLSTLSSSREKLASVYSESSVGGARRGSACGSHAPSEYSGHLNSSSRASSRASSARASPVVEERPEKDFTEKGTRNMPSLSAATLASLGGTSSRRGSGDTSVSLDTETSIREIKDSLAEVEEKYKKAMVSNAQLDNEKTNFMYQVDTLKDMLLELEEQLAESQRQYEEKNREFEREKHAHSILQFQFAEVKEALKQREEMLEEIRQLQQKQASYIREISDLQETIEWKDKKIGALERQKEFFDSIRSERDDLREEIVKLKEELKKHGIVLNSEIATNGETSDTLNNVEYPDPTKMTEEEFNAVKSAGDGTLGRATEVEVKNEIVETVGKRETLQNAEQEQHKEHTIQECVDIEGLHPGGKAEHSAPFPEPLASAECEQQVQSQILESTSCLENPEQVESNKIRDMPDSRTGASPEQSEYLGDVDAEVPGPMHGQDSCNALDVKNQSENSVRSQEKEKQENLKTDLEEIIPKPCEGSIPGLITEADNTDSGGPGGNHTENVLDVGETEVGEPVSTVVSNPPEHNGDTVSPDGKSVVDELDPSTGHSSERELPKEATVQSTVGRENTAEEGENPIQAETQTIPGAPAAKSCHQETTGPNKEDAESELIDVKELDEEKNSHQAEALDSSQKKTKNKKKKNKKKKSSASVETPLKDVKNKLTCQSTDAGEAEEEGQVQLADKKQGAEAQNEVTKNLKQEIIAGSSECVDCSENPKTELDGTQNQEDDDVNRKKGEVTADGDTLPCEDDTVHLSGTSASDKELDEQVTKVCADGMAQSCPLEPENEDGNSSSLLESKSPSQDINGASQIESAERHLLSKHPGQTAQKALDSISPEHDDLSAPTGRVGDFNSESEGHARGENEKGKSKEDCTLS
ncbi:leucine-rich repeat flightless-interacting protein 1 isoform X5 [Castor canadensis]|uniref:Leucine-rich repeat flightless-interacting protein 1 isoform X5 n=1 Tax=Castor canadensis TaxID=51338 RepID=A0AC58MFK1_CASCN